MLILIISLLTSLLIFKVTLMSWLSFVLILTFSSGMMTLFMYTSSLTSNESSMTKKSSWIVMVLFIFLLIPTSNNKMVFQDSMKIFSNQITMILMSIILILTMLSISYHGHHPDQTLATSF